MTTFTFISMQVQSPRALGPASWHCSSGNPPVAGIDIGGTKVAVCVADSAGVRGRLVEPTVKTGDNGALAAQILRMVGASCATAGLDVTQVTALGVSSCGPFVRREGLIEIAAPNICGGLSGSPLGLANNWTTALLEAPLRAVFGDVRIGNDAVGGLEAERRWGALRASAVGGVCVVGEVGAWDGNGQDSVALDHCAYVTWSTGVGVGLCVDGRVLRGKNGNAGHAGHLFVSDLAHNHGSGDAALCGCGNVGDVEGLISGNAIARRFASQGFADAAHLMTAAKAGDLQAMAIVDELCRVMGRALYNLVASLDLERISLGGSVYWHHRDFLLPKLRAQIQGKLPALTDGFELVSAGLGEAVGDFAALAMVTPEHTPENTSGSQR
jgi:glucokinase